MCDYDPDAAAKVSDAAIAIHTAYSPTASGAHAWGAPLYNLVMSTTRTPASTIALTAG